MVRGKIGAGRTQRRDRRSRRCRIAMGVVAPMLVLLPGVIAVESARAGTYVMHNCDVPGYQDSPLFPWDVPASVPGVAKLEDGCATGGGLAFTLEEPWHVQESSGRYIWLHKPTGARSHIKLVKAVLWYAARLAGSGKPLTFHTGEYRSDGSYHHGLSDLPPGSENLVGEQQFAPDTTAFRVGLVCAADALETCVAANRVPLLIRGMEVTLSEDIPPLVLPPSGILLDGGPQSGLRSLTYSASDPQSGLREVDVLLGDTVVASHDLAPRCSYSDFTVCPASAGETLEVDTRAVPNGSYDVALRVRDAAGNERLMRGERTVDIANEPAPATTNVGGGPVTATTSVGGGAAPAPSVANGPVPATTSVLPCTVDVAFKGIAGRTLTVPYGRRVTVQGRLVQGQQLTAGAPIQVLERPDRRGAPEKLTRAVATKPDGSFSIGLATSRPSRVVRFACRPAGGDQAISQALRLRVRAASTLRASLRGVVVRFSGRVRSGPMPKRGKRVQLEGRSPGSAWTPFRTFRTDRKGGFSGTYRLRVRRPGVTLKIRAVVPSEDGYGYVGSRSRAVTLRVR